MTRTKGSTNSMARRVAIASITVLASSGVGLVAAPMAFGQISLSSPLLGSSQGTQVTNAGSASANTGGNTAIGNGSTNTASATAPAGGLVDVPISLGAPTNTSDGSATVTSGAATAVGNGSGTTVGQSNASGNQVSGFLAGQHQGAGVTNAGSAGANTGGNTAIGNGSQNTATVNQNVSGGLVGVGVTLGGPVNNSTGEATINSGAANAAGNSSQTTVGQASGGGPGGIGGPGALVRPGVGAIGGIGGPGTGPAPCNASRFGSFQNVNVRNEGQAQATTGNNVAIGNASTNNASTEVASSGQTVSGSLLGVGLTIGGPVNNSTGTAVINTGPATAVGNNSTTVVGQVEGCPQVAHLAAAGRPGVIVPAGQVQRTGTLARTGLDTADLGMIAGALLGAGMLLVASQRRRMAAARSAAVPMAGFGFGLGGDDWVGAVR
jgi:hypothetical protein